MNCSKINPRKMKIRGHTNQFSTFPTGFLVKRRYNVLAGNCVIFLTHKAIGNFQTYYLLTQVLHRYHETF